MGFDYCCPAYAGMTGVGRDDENENSVGWALPTVFPLTRHSRGSGNLVTYGVYGIQRLAGYPFPRI